MRRSSARAVVVRCSSGYGVDSPGLVSGPHLLCHLEADLPLLGVGGLGCAFIEYATVRAAVRIHIVHAHVPGPGRLCGGQHSALQRREIFGPAVVLRIERLVHSVRVRSSSRGESGICGVPGEDFNIRKRGSIRPERVSPTPVDQADLYPSAQECLGRGAADRATAENDMHAHADVRFAAGARASRAEGAQGSLVSALLAGAAPRPAARAKRCVLRRLLADPCMRSVCPRSAVGVCRHLFRRCRRPQRQGKCRAAVVRWAQGYPGC